jgi:hypothetical protein
MSHSISLSRDVTGHVDGTIQGTRIKITVTSTTGLSAKLFVYREVPLNPNDATAVAQFDHVASPSDLEDFPEDAPTAGSDPSWFRLNVVDVVVRSRAIADELWDAILKDVTDLKTTLDRLDTFESQDDFTI